MILKDHLPGLFSMFVFARDSNLESYDSAL